MKSNNIQLRGNCQCCGRLQAVTSGRVAKHGYEVKDRGQGGWFHGVCSGHVYAPIQVERTIADGVVKNVRAEVVAIHQLSALIASGKANPKFAGNRYDFATNKNIPVPFGDADKYNQAEARRSEVHKLDSRAKVGESWADDFDKLINRVHGKPLQQVKKPDAPAPITIGEKRQGATLVLTASYVQGARCYWKASNGNKGWMATRSWRELPIAA